MPEDLVIDRPRLPTVDDALALGLTRGEYELVCEKLGRAPNRLELAVFSLLWSEHCAYKHSRRLLPGALLGNLNRRFTFRQLQLQVANADTAFTRTCTEGERLSIPAKHAWGRYYAAEETLQAIERGGQVLLRYAPGHNFNGSAHDIAGVMNEAGNVFGLMPHPEHAVDPLTGSSDGLKLFESMRLSVEGVHA